MRSDIF